MITTSVAERLREIATSPNDVSLRRWLVGTLVSLLSYVLFAWFPFRNVPKTSAASGSADSDAKEARPPSQPTASSWKHFLRILRIAFPRLRSTQGKYLLFLTTLLVIRTQLSVVIARKLGTVAGALIQGNKRDFVKALLTFIAWTIPAALVNSGLKFCVGTLNLSMREKLTRSFHARYFQPGVFFQLAGLNEACGGLTFIEQRMTQDLQRWAAQAVSTYTVLFKPLLDIALYSRDIANMSHGNYRGPLVIGGYYALISFLLKYITPSLGKLANRQTEYDAAYRSELVRQLGDAREIAICRSEMTERRRLDVLYNASSNHVYYSAALRGWADFVDGFLLRGMSVAVGTGVVGWIVDGRYQELAAGAAAAHAAEGTTSSNVTLGTAPTAELASLFINSSTMLMHLTRSVGQLVQAYRSLSYMSGFTDRVHQLHLALQVAEEHEARRKSEVDVDGLEDEIGSFGSPAVVQDSNDVSPMQRPPLSAYRLSPYIVFEHVTLATPPTHSKVTNAHLATAQRMQPLSSLDDTSLSTTAAALNLQSPTSMGDTNNFSTVGVPRILCRDLTFTIKPGMNVLVVGPNGCGKSSMFRVLAELWPLTSPPPSATETTGVPSTPAGYGSLSKPSREQLYYVSQRPYMSSGSLLEQVIYPTRKKSLKVGESELMKYFEIVGLEGLFDRPNVSWDSHLKWSNDDVLTVGEKQKLALARMFFHNPKYAILDECTSALDLETEARVYRTCSERGITVFSIAHRRSVWPVHNWVLKFDDEGHYAFSPMKMVTIEGDVASLQSRSLRRVGSAHLNTPLVASSRSVAQTEQSSVAISSNETGSMELTASASNNNNKGANTSAGGKKRKTFLILTKITESNVAHLVGTTATYLVDIDGRPVEVLTNGNGENDEEEGGDDRFATPLSSLRSYAAATAVHPHAANSTTTSLTASIHTPTEATRR